MSFKYRNIKRTSLSKLSFQMSQQLTVGSQAKPRLSLDICMGKEWSILYKARDMLDKVGNGLGPGPWGNCDCGPWESNSSSAKGQWLSVPRPLCTFEISCVPFVQHCLIIMLTPSHCIIVIVIVIVFQVLYKMLSYFHKHFIHISVPLVLLWSPLWSRLSNRCHAHWINSNEGEQIIQWVSEFPEETCQELITVQCEKGWNYRNNGGEGQSAMHEIQDTGYREKIYLGAQIHMSIWSAGSTALSLLQGRTSW